MVLTFESVKEIWECEHPNESYCEKFFHVVLRFIMLYKVVLTFDSVEDLELRVWTFKESYSEQLLDLSREKIWCLWKVKITLKSPIIGP